MSGYRFHPEAEADVDATWEFIAEDSLEAADRMIDAIQATIEALVPFPHQGHRRPDLTERSLRFTTAGNYLIAYAPDKRPLWVIAVMHGRRSPARDGGHLERQGVMIKLRDNGRGQAPALVPSRQNRTRFVVGRRVFRLGYAR
jgi:plasmid stabilization system protein ParE